MIMADDDHDQTRQAQERRQVARRKLEEDRRNLHTEFELRDDDPFAYIPDLAMKVVIKHMNCPKDKISLNQASKNAEKNLRKTRAKWLLYKVFPIPTLLQYLTRQQILDFRRVCWDWKVSVDNYLQEATRLDAVTHPPLLIWANRQHLGLHNKLALSPNLKHHPSHLDRFMEEAGQNTGNPFISRRADFAWNFREATENNELEYWTKVLQLLTKYGREIWSADIGCSSLLAGEVILKTINKCLLLMPNLTFLDCSIRSHFAGGRTANFRAYPNLTPLQNLSRLSTAILSHSIYDIACRRRLCGKYFSQLVSLRIDNDNFLHLYNPRIHSTFPNLQYMTLFVGNEKGEDDVLLKLQLLTSPLKQVSIQTSWETPICLSVLFHIMTHFKETLTAAKFDQVGFTCAPVANPSRPFDGERRAEFKMLKSYGVPEPDEFHLPHLTTLSVNLLGCGFGSLDSLLKLRAPLKQLEVEVGFCRSWNGEEVYHGSGPDVINMHGIESRMQDSNIWWLLPSLEVMYLQWLSIDPARGMQMHDLRFSRRQLDA